MKNKKSGFTILPIFMIVISLVSTGLITINVMNIMNNNSGKEIESETVTNQFYTLNGYATEYQKNIFDELTDALNAEEKDDLTIAGLVAKSFVTDLFTWTNKDGNYEVGGQQYVYGSALGPFNTYIKDTLYSELDLYITQYGRDYLPEVANVEVSVHDIKSFSTYFDTFPAYYVYVSWQYKEHVVEDGAMSKVVDTTCFPSELNVYIIKTPEGRFEIVEFY